MKAMMRIHFGSEVMHQNCSIPLKAAQEKVGWRFFRGKWLSCLSEHRSSGFYENDPGWQQQSQRTERGVMRLWKTSNRYWMWAEHPGLPKQEIPQNNSSFTGTYQLWKNNKQGKKAIKFSFYCLFIFIFLLGKKWIILQFLFTLFSKDVEKTETCACKRSHHVLRCLILLKRWKTNYALLWLLLLNKICLRHIDVGEHDQIKHLFNPSSKVTGLFIY